MSTVSREEILSVLGREGEIEDDRPLEDHRNGEVCLALRRKHFVDQLALPEQRMLELPTIAAKVDADFFEEIMSDVYSGKVLTVKDLASRLKISVDKARDEIKAQLGNFKVGSDYRLPECAFRKMMMRRVGYLN